MDPAPPAPASPPTPPARSTAPARRRLRVPAAILAVTALLIAVVLWTRPAGAPEGAPGAATDTLGAQEPVALEDLPHPSRVAVPDLSAAETRDPGDLLAEGPVDAPVVLVVFTDYQCPYCARWTADTLPALREEVEAGRLRIEWRDVNVYGEDSERAARAALAAARQDRHADYQNALFEGGEIRSGAELDEEALIALADELGLDVEQFTADLRAEETARTIAEHATTGRELGVVTTPSFVLDGTPIVGAQPTDAFLARFDEALAAADHGEG